LRVDARDNARSIFTRCRAFATPLDFKSSWSLNERKLKSAKKHQAKFYLRCK